MDALHDVRWSSSPFSLRGQRTDFLNPPQIVKLGYARYIGAFFTR